MVALSDLSTSHGSAAALSRLRKRRRAEVRLKAYGIAAISLAALALVTLMSTVVGQAVDALTETYITLDVPLDPEEIDPEGTGDPAEIGRYNYDGLVKDVLKETFPSVSGRSARRELYGIVSGGAQFELREQVMADPSLLGQTVAVPMLASDVTDLYLKGRYGALRPQDHSGNLSVTLDEDGEVATIESSAPDFANALAEVKDLLSDQAAFLRNQARLQDRGARVFAEDAAEMDESDERTSLLAQSEARAAEADRLLAEADALDVRANADLGQEALTTSAPSLLLQVNGAWIKMTEVSTSGGVGEVLYGQPSAENAAPSEWSYSLHQTPETARKISDRQIAMVEVLKEQGQVEQVFNTRFFSAGDSREPELAGIWGAAVGSFWTMLVTFSLAFPIGVMAAIYLEEFAPKNRFTDFVEVNINNLAAVPSIVFGLLGLAVFLGFFGVPRSSPLAGGIVLALMTLPTIIIASRAAIRAVPPSIRDAALGLGASRLQTSFHHVLPLAMPGILTGTIIGMAQALGETAPLIMIGMVAFIVDIPTGITDSATVLPVQVFRWSDFPERAFEARTAAAICMLLLFLVVMNAIAVFLRKRFERRW